MKYLHEPIHNYPRVWKGRSPRNGNASIHYTPQTGIDGGDQYSKSWEYKLALEGTIESGELTYISGTYLPTEEKPKSDSGVGNFGRGFFRLPKMIRVIHGYGWYYWEQYRSQVYGTDEFQSFYMPTKAIGEFQSCIDYGNPLRDKLIEFCQLHKIALQFLGGASFNEYRGPTEHGRLGNSILTGLTKQHQARWLWRLGARYPLNCFWDLPFNTTGITTEDINAFSAADVVGGEVLNIIFVTDGFSAYHGVPCGDFHPDYPNIVTGSHSVMMSDIQRIKDQYLRFKHWGTIIVNSCKNAEFFPQWVKSNWGQNYGQVWMLQEAQRHLDEAVAALSDMNVSLLCRRVAEGFTPDTPAYHSAEFKHLKFVTPQISINSIMDKVREFWDA